MSKEYSKLERELMALIRQLKENKRTKCRKRSRSRSRSEGDGPKRRGSRRRSAKRNRSGSESRSPSPEGGSPKSGRIYCVYCKAKTPTLELTEKRSKNNRYYYVGRCENCRKKKAQFV